ncbi:Gti1/Pac2 family-domain-containing protein [Coniochaeta sp. 2T2.1]|nr:Gti1/Pac2 family-domain-containing protein [Coniochaeta sp. 2T2.1]
METYYGCVRTPSDAIKLFEACRVGLLPRVQRRLSEKERQAIRSGSVFVWDEREAGMRRWTDGKSWSASRVSGSFLTYREMEGKRGAAFPPTRRIQTDTTPESGRGSDEDQDDGEIDGYRYKIDGLMKQSFSITTSTGQHLHLISYYSRPQAGQPDLPQPCTDPSLRHIVPAKGMYPESSVHESQGPALSRGPMNQTSYTLALQPPPPPPGPPQHHYQVQYAPPGYQWPPSPVATPPYSHPHYAAYSQAPLPPPGQHHQYHPQPPPHHYQHQQPHPHQPPPYHQPPPNQHHERSPLPHPQPSSHPSQQHAPQQHPSQQSNAASHDSPRAQHLQAAAREAVLIDPRLSTSAPRGHEQTQLPPINSNHSGHNQQQRHSPAPLVATPSRTLSASPPKSSHSEAANGTNGATTNGGSSSTYNKTSLSSLLHPTPTNSEPNSANPGTNSAGSSPRAVANGGAANVPAPSQRGEDVRALRVLDKKFCI